MNTPFKNAPDLQGNSTQMNQQKCLYPSMNSGFIPFQESTPINRNKYLHNHTPHKVAYFSGNRQNQRSEEKSNWSQNRNRNFKQNNYRNNLNFSTTEEDTNTNDNKDGESYFNRPQHNMNRFNNFSSNKRNFNHNRRGNNRSNYNAGNQKKNNDISDYVHPSMMEDPWKDLEERHNALHKGNLKIFDSENEESDNQSSPDSNKASSLNVGESNSIRIADN